METDPGRGAEGDGECGGEDRASQKAGVAVGEYAGGSGGKEEKLGNDVGCESNPRFMLHGRFVIQLF